MKNIYVVCPANLSTGGPEVLHQLCYTLRRLKYNAQMYYYGFDKVKNSSPTPMDYKMYNNPFVLNIEDNENNIIIIPEVRYDMLKIYHKSKLIFWWLSVDNYLNQQISGGLLYKLGMSKLTIYKLKRKVHLINDVDLLSNKVIHFVQSKYAEELCKYLNVPIKNIYYLSDYLNPVFIKNAINKEVDIKKENIVLYNPKKGYKFTKKIIEKATDIRFIPLINLSRIEVSNLLLKSKVYIDFGNHPGKDRIPREAAISGCCIITGMKGAAKYYEDIPISNEFKFKDDIKNIDLIINKIRDIMYNFEMNTSKFKEYRTFIRNEENTFKNNVINIFDKIAK